MLLAFDLDKTLVTNDYQLPAATLAAVMAAKAKGHLVTVLTGRPLGSALPFIEQLDLDLPHSVNHGAKIRQRNGEPLRRTQLTAGEVDALLESHLDDVEIEFSCVIDDTLYVRDPESSRWTWVHSESRSIMHFRTGLDLAADKVVFHGNGRSEELDRWVAENHPSLLRYLWGDGFLEVVPAGADKGSALAFIADRLGVPQKDVVAFGDGLNDVTMLGWAGHGVSVGPEAHHDALAAADEHVDSPEESGVAGWLERNLL